MPRRWIHILIAFHSYPHRRDKRSYEGGQVVLCVPLPQFTAMGALGMTLSLDDKGSKETVYAVIELPYTLAQDIGRSDLDPTTTRNPGNVDLCEFADRDANGGWGQSFR
jgi:hypothetical protein